MSLAMLVYICASMMIAIFCCVLSRPWKGSEDKYAIAVDQLYFKMQTHVDRLQTHVDRLQTHESFHPYLSNYVVNHWRELTVIRTLVTFHATSLVAHVYKLSVAK